MSRSGPAQITSTDINPDKYSFSNLEAMRLAFPGLEDEELARYLIARNDDLDKAKAQLQKAVDWRAGFFPIMKEDCGDEFPAGKLISYGEDKEGRPVMFWNARLNVASERDLEKMAKTVVWWTEYTIRRMPSQFSKFTILMDRVGFTRENADMDFAKHVSAIMQDAYPERVHQIIIYPADFVFYTIWNIGKWFLDPVTRNKVKPMLQFVGVEQYVERQYILKNMGGDADFVFDATKYEELWPAKKEEGAEAAAATADA